MLLILPVHLASSRRMRIYKHRIHIQSDNVNICTLSTVDLSSSLFKGAIKLNAHMNVATLLYLSINPLSPANDQYQYRFLQK